MTAPRLTPAMVAALRLASRDAIRYYRGGWYSIPAFSGDDQQANGLTLGSCPTPATLRALVKRDLLEVTDPLIATVLGRATIYDRRWTLTPAGRAALAEHERSAAK